MNATKWIVPVALLAAMGVAHAGSQSEGSAGKSFEQLDQNGDGKVSQKEAERVPELAQNFAQLDANGDGALSRNEIGMGGPEKSKEQGSGSEY